jgi:hypothetical protein
VQSHVKIGVTVGYDVQIEFTTHELSGALPHGSGTRGISKKVKYGGRERARVARWDHVAIPALRHDIVTAGHARSNDRHAGQAGFQKNARNSFAILGRKSNYFSNAENGRNNR